MLPIRSPNRCLQASGGTLLRGEERTILLNWLKSASREFFQLKRHNIHDYDTRNKDKLVVNRVKLESTKRAVFFYKGADIFNNCI